MDVNHSGHQSIHNNHDDCLPEPVDRPLSYAQLRRLNMTDEQKNLERARARVRYREHRNRMTEEQLAHQRESARLRARSRLQNMNEEERANRREHLRLQARIHRQNRRQQTTFGSPHAEPSNLACVQTDVPNDVHPITNSDVIGRLKSHLQSEVGRLGLSAVLPSLNTNMDFISINRSNNLCPFMMSISEEIGLSTKFQLTFILMNKVMHPTMCCKKVFHNQGEELAAKDLITTVLEML
ncbi:hypothetical protein FRX31_023134 [Thalictrum thalictroides]|uniref:Uncharacterized protein n=1 Tax=Thalictrum thalictroides TaxID=46969 RepID=A0A7J6VR92_THATH|nr:hypothetical protein FRX31_023134 [Thalictrum thalictroides]